MRRIAAVILNYRSGEDTIACISSLLKDGGTALSLVIVDNASGDDSAERIRAWLNANGRPCKYRLEDDRDEEGALSDTTLIQAKSNRGYAVGNNLGARLAVKGGAEFILIVNADVVFARDAIVRLVEFAERCAECGAVGPKIVNADGDVDRTCARRRSGVLDYLCRIGIVQLLAPNNRWVRRHHYEGEYSFEKAREVDILSGACMLFKARCIEEIGFFDEETFLYVEEFIVCERLRRTSYKSFVEPGATVVHKRGGASEGETRRRLREAANRSLDYYLREYRGVGPAMRALITGSARLGAMLSDGRRWFKRRHSTPY